MQCPECGSDNVERFTPHALSCTDCGFDARADEFGHKRQTSDDLAEVLSEALRENKVVK